MAITHAAIAAAGTSLVLGTSDVLPLVLAVVGVAAARSGLDSECHWSGVFSGGQLA